MSIRETIVFLSSLSKELNLDINSLSCVQNTETGGEYEGDYILSATGYDAAGMNYGYTYRNYVDTTISDYVKSDKRGLYSPLEARALYNAYFMIK